MKIPFFIQEFTLENAVLDTLRNEQFVGGESVSKFEDEFAKYIGTKYAVSVRNGAYIYHYLRLDYQIIQKLTPTNSFIASANCIRMINAKPILCDIHYEDGNIDMNSVNDSADAIIPVHIYGNPCDFDSVRIFAEEHKIPIIEDACQAHGAEYKNKKVGSYLTWVVFHFTPQKI